MVLPFHLVNLADLIRDLAKPLPQRKKGGGAHYGNRP